MTICTFGCPSGSRERPWLGYGQVETSRMSDGESPVLICWDESLHAVILETAVSASRWRSVSLTSNALDEVRKARLDLGMFLSTHLLQGYVLACINSLNC